jgi:hypothetical protein
MLARSGAVATNFKVAVLAENKAEFQNNVLKFPA